MIDLYHSILISGKNTYTEWGLIPTERPSINPPAVKSGFIDLPSSNESIDYTEFLTGEPNYGQSTGSWTFYFDPEWIPPASGISGINSTINWIAQSREKALTGKLWAVVYSSLLNYVHGQVHKIILEDDPVTVYKGRLTVNGWTSGNPYSTVSISYNIDPEIGKIGYNS